MCWFILRRRTAENASTRYEYHIRPGVGWSAWQDEAQRHTTYALAEESQRESGGEIVLLLGRHCADDHADEMRLQRKIV